MNKAIPNLINFWTFKVWQPCPVLSRTMSRDHKKIIKKKLIKANNNLILKKLSCILMNKFKIKFVMATLKKKGQGLCVTIWQSWKWLNFIINFLHYKYKN